MSDTNESFREWLEDKKDSAQRDYRSGTRSENPRRSDIDLGKFRAYREVYRELLKRQAETTEGEDNA